ncbi:copper-containing nitrite reductase [Bradyrhizobium sp.]|uniref:copper-containing nitrite reductase n=1 Tax=Bradyrhizobium sp. TaxID=376 RepID=UPI0027331B5C|nr:copper-containing nitrite reductase [Bradyrhizobium sp.]MDP3691522.1 copper-containing nitrite reductase [Bradyrhizobium sp.]
MQRWITEKLQQWLILVLGVVVIGGSIAIGALFQSTPGPTNSVQVAETTQNDAAKSSSAPQGAAPVPLGSQPTSTAPKTAPLAPESKSATAPSADINATAPARESDKATTDTNTKANNAIAPASQVARTAVPIIHNHAAAAPPTTGQSAPAAVASTGDTAAGQQVYRKCRACHSLEAGKNGLGPSLAGIVGEKAAAVPGYNFSPAMKMSNLTWDAATLDAYLADPQKVVPGNKMPFPGLKTERERSAVIAFLAASPKAGSAATAAAPAKAPSPAQITAATPVPAPTQTAPTTPSDSPQAGANYVPGLRYTLRSGIAEGRMVFIGVGGSIEGQVNPLLSAAEGQVVQITLINGEGAEHDIVFADQGPGGASSHIVGRGASTSIAFVASKAGDYLYYCSVPGHQLAGMEGKFLITPQPPPQTVVEADISQKPTDVPPSIGNRGPQTVRVDLVTVELEARLAEGTTFGYWTFNGKVPGPMLRVRVGDTVEVHLKNADGSSMLHSVDFHAATGPGGGAASTQTNPGEEKSFRFKALTPGLFVYHCATPMVAHHIANGMYGLILVEPEGGLPPVDREYYVMQGEIYTDGAFGQHGSQEFNVEKLLNERPEYFVFNGSVGALSKFHPMQAKVGETVRIYFGVGGPNFTSSFHVIGEIFDKVYNLGGVTSEPLRGIQTVLVPAGGAVITEFKVDVPGSYTLVDHALARAERGLVGVLNVEGPSNTDIFDGKVEPGSGH